jgi:cellulose synthase (UDP-forming)
VTRPLDPRLARPAWDAAEAPPRWRIRALVLLAIPLAAWYFGWLLQPERIGEPILYGLLVGAELFNLVQASGFWWTVTRAPARLVPGRRRRSAVVDVLIPVYDEPVEIVEPTVAAARRMRGARVRVHVLDDSQRPEVEDMARRQGARYVTRRKHVGAKAGNINNALRRTAAPFVIVLDCDHVPSPAFIERTLPAMADERVAFVQTPQYYGNSRAGGIAAAAWSQQALFFGAISRGKAAQGAMFCCGTNVLFRRRALESVGGFPTDSVTEDFELSVMLHERGWRTHYVPEVLATGLGPEDMASYVSQQQRWARGCLGAIGSALRAKLPGRVRLQYLLSSMYFLSGWTLLVYMSFPIVRIATGAQPIAEASADQFLIHFAPYFGVALATVAIAGAGAYAFAGFALAAASFWIHIQATLRALLRRPARFIVTPKRGAAGRQPRAVAPALLAIAALVGVSVYGLVESRSPGTLNNIAFALLHVTVLSCGVSAALWGRSAAARARGEVAEEADAAAERAAVRARDTDEEAEHVEEAA